MEVQHEKDPDFRSIVNAAAANWYEQRSISPNVSQPHSSTYDEQRRSPQSNEEGQPSNSAGAGAPANIGSDNTAWQTALLSLPEEFRSSPLPLHPLPQLLAVQPTLRPIEWNRYRQYGGFVPRTPHDFSSLMIYASGQVNPNPCRRCILKNGPFALCIVSPPSVLAQSSLKHACANCTYQNQYKKCTNEPITKEELVRSQASRSVARSRDTPIPRKPKVPGSGGSNGGGGGGVRKYQHYKDSSVLNSSSHSAVVAAAAAAAAAATTATTHTSNNTATAATAATATASTTAPARRNGGRPKKQQPDYGYVVRKPSAQSITADSFADKLRHVRSWSPRSRRRMNAEVLQWQAAIATVEAEKSQSRQAVRHDHRYQPHQLRVPHSQPHQPHPHQVVDDVGMMTPTPIQAQTPRLPFPTAATTSSMFAPPSVSIEGSVAEEMGDDDGQMMMDDGGEEMGDGEEEDDNSYGEDEQQDYEVDGPSWVGFDDGPPLKPPL